MAIPLLDRTSVSTICLQYLIYLFNITVSIKHKGRKSATKQSRSVFARHKGPNGCNIDSTASSSSLISRFCNCFNSFKNIFFCLLDIIDLLYFIFLYVSLFFNAFYLFSTMCNVFFCERTISF